MHFLISCEFSDAAAVAVCMEGLKAHADVEAFPVWLADSLVKDEVLTMVPHLKVLEDTWYAAFPNHASLETFVQLMESVPFTQEDFIRIVDADPDQGVFRVWNMEQFHKAVIVEGLFRNA